MIEVRSLSKKYRVYHRRSDRIREWISFGRKVCHDDFWALRNINLHVPSGRVFGLVGMNGAGKSTLLKILTGTTVPTTGSVKIEGRVAALLELGTGFHQELSGRDNCFINGKLLGLTDREISERIEGIKSFSELGEFFDKPVRTYSSGMYVRLAFALASSIDPDILIIDEALSVGDAYFQQKCLERIKEFKERGVTILFVSHDLGTVKMLCDEVALMRQGEIIGRGDADKILELYNAELARHEGSGSEYVIRRQHGQNGEEQMVSGNFRAEIAGIRMTDPEGNDLSALTSGDRVKLTAKVKFNDDLDNPTVGILIRDRLGYDVFGTNTTEMAIPTGSYKKGDNKDFVFDLPMALGPGEYTVTVAVHASRTHTAECYQWIDRLLTFKVLPRPDRRFIGVAALEPTISIQ